MKTHTAESRTKNSGKRQRLRKGLLLVSFLLFPVTMNFLSPYVIIDGAAGGIVSGSLLIFTALFLGSLFFGRAFCGWICPGGALQEMSAQVNGKPVKRKRTDWIKYLIWAPWLTLIVVLFVRAGGVRRIAPLHLTESGISVDAPGKYIIYFAVIGLLLALSLTLGRRGACHSICWMSPFMISGRKLRNFFGWPALGLKAGSGSCTSCGTCSAGCPMSLDVKEMVVSGRVEHSECILCGNCVDACPSGTLHYSFGSSRSIVKQTVE